MVCHRLRQGRSLLMGEGHFFFQAEDGIRDYKVTGVQTCALPICALTPDEAQSVLAKIKENPEDADRYWTLVRHYEYKGNVRDLDALRLWYIEDRKSVV